MKSNITYGIILIVFPSMVSSCTKDVVPTLSTSEVTEIEATSAMSGGTITFDGGAEVTERGVCWSLTAQPTIADSKSSDGTGVGQFVSLVNDLKEGSTYHLRAYATNEVGTAYGNEVTFTTLGQSPSCITLAANNITPTSATLHATVNANFVSTNVVFEYGMTTSYGQTVTASQSPVLGNEITNVSAEISGLNSNTIYYFRIRAENAIWTPSKDYHIASQQHIIWRWNSVPGAIGYKWNSTNDFEGAIDLGSVNTYTESNTVCYTHYERYVWAYSDCDVSEARIISTNTPPCVIPCPFFATITDERDGKVYHTILLGNQCWLKENMNVGIRIDGSLDQTNNHILEKYCYDNDEKNCDLYGGLYQWSEAINYQLGDASVCPNGWRIPSEEDWQTLFDFLGLGMVGEKMKSVGTIEEGTGLWSFPNFASNASDFTALPGGIRSRSGEFFNAKTQANFWSMTDGIYGAKAATLQNDGWDVFPSDYFKTLGLSVRCVLSVPVYGR